MPVLGNHAFFYICIHNFANNSVLKIDNYILNKQISISNCSVHSYKEVSSAHIYITSYILISLAPIAIITGQQKIEREPNRRTVTGSITCSGKDIDGTVTSTRLVLVRLVEKELKYSWWLYDNIIYGKYCFTFTKETIFQDSQCS